MHRKTAVVWMSLAVAMLVLPMLTTAQAQDLPEGVSVKVLGEFPSDRPGIETLRLIEFRMEPGAKWESHVVAHTALWTAVQGLLTVVSDGETVIRGPGSRWVLSKGMTMDLYNNGSEPHVQHVWQLIASQ